MKRRRACLEAWPPWRCAIIARQGWNVLREDLPLPLAVLRESALSHKGGWMRRFPAESGAVISPHGKTTMSPQLFSRQMKDGAWAITIASVQQLQVARHYGFDRIAAATRAAKLKRSLQLIVEGGFLGGRTGCRQLDQAMAVARTVKANEPYLSLRGVGGYEGLLRGKTPAEVGRLVTDFLGYLIEIAVTCDREDCFAAGTVLLTGGGSTFYDLVTRQFARAGVQRRFIVLTRSGCYLTHDSGAYLDSFAELRKRTPEVDELGPGPAAALEIWSYVQSRPESEKAILAVGKRDISDDSRLPQPLKWFRPSAAANARDIKPSGGPYRHRPQRSALSP